MTIYFADKSITFSASKIVECDTIIDTDRGNSIDLKGVLRLFESHNNLCIVSQDPQASFDNFASELTPVTAAGGVVTNPQDEVLMINRFSRWDLPKGHHEQGETIEQCALREVEEETGVCPLHLGAKIGYTLHAYEKNGAWELKTTHWWQMTSPQTAPPKPQSEEGITAAEWIPRARVAELIQSSFPTIRTILTPMPQSLV